ncbi:hypothetical protein [Burkholderia vietnamiensis]|uniref:hypothetical protein n=1 Tax=Burkholderia vietnamiensis TaxID=60552 RepID=UPI00158BC74A|nr:hypothetical protein [Burkholderia vietnamiensis]
MARIGKIVLPTTTANVAGQSITYANSTQLEHILQRMAEQLDALSSGQVAAKWNAADAPPTAVGKAITTNPTSKVLGITYGVGDFIPKKTPSVVTIGGHNYLLIGWYCTKAGNTGTANPPTFAECYAVVDPF